VRLGGAVNGLAYGQEEEDGARDRNERPPDENALARVELVGAVKCVARAPVDDTRPRVPASSAHGADTCRANGHTRTSAQDTLRVVTGQQRSSPDERRESG
jgi:hypothetical protein